MKGSEFRAIRRFNRIRQIDIAELAGFRNAVTIKEVEESEKVPFLFVNALSNKLGLDLTDEENARKELEGIPEHLHKKIEYNKKPKYSNLPAIFVLKEQ